MNGAEAAQQLRDMAIGLVVIRETLDDIKNVESTALTITSTSLLQTALHVEARCGIEVPE